MRKSTLALLFTAVIILNTASFILADEKTGDQAKKGVLVVYSSGQPLVGYAEVDDPSGLEAITTPTHLERNTSDAARRICAKLKEQGIPVRLARAEDFTKDDWREVFSYEMIVLGSPARYWQMSWEMKKFIDLVFNRVYYLKGQSDGRMFSLFCTASSERSSNGTMEQMASTIDFISGKVVLRLPLYHEMSQQEFDTAIDKFAGSLGVLVR